MFIISGPSGSGKDTLIQKLFCKRHDIKFSISSVSRLPRCNEIDGEKYNFVSREYFENMIKHDELLEYTEYIGNYYGTPKAQIFQWIKDGNDVIIEVEVNGAKNIKRQYPEAISIFIMPPTYQTLVNRLIGRATEDFDTAKKRLDQSINEISAATDYDFIVINGDIDIAVNELSMIISSNKYKSINMKKIIEEVLSDAKSFNWETYKRV